MLTVRINIREKNIKPKFIWGGVIDMVRLRPFKVSDFKYLMEWVGDERQFAMWCANKFSYPLTKQQLLDYKEMYENDEQGWIFTALSDGGKPIGHLLMRKADYSNQSVHFGFIIVDPQFRGNGIGREMVSQAVKYAFEILWVNEVTLGVFDNNPAAHRCYLAVGFQDVTYHSEKFPYKDEKWGLYDMKIQNNI
jgi:RimJ/RimL family protein N-acetyltransferase